MDETVYEQIKQHGLEIGYMRALRHVVMRCPEAVDVCSALMNPANRPVDPPRTAPEGRSAPQISKPTQDAIDYLGLAGGAPGASGG